MIKKLPLRIFMMGLVILIILPIAICILLKEIIDGEYDIYSEEFLKAVREKL